MDISFITTVFDEEENVRPFLESVLSQTRPPDEIIIVDGMSTDRTADIIREMIDASRPVHLIRTPCSVAKGRNIAIEAAQYDVIAVSDAGCELEPDWLERIVRPFEDTDIDVASGFYLPKSMNYFSDVCSRLLFIRVELLNSDNFSPSSRSIAFRKRAWQAVGGYPDTSFYGEDSFFNEALRKAGFRFQFTPEAIVHWALRPGFRKLWRQYYLYSFGDGYLSAKRGENMTRLGIHMVGYCCMLLGFLRLPVFFVGVAFLLVYYLALLARRLRKSRPLRLRDIPMAMGILLTRGHALSCGYIAGLLRNYGIDLRRTN